MHTKDVSRRNLGRLSPVGDRRELRHGHFGLMCSTRTRCSSAFSFRSRPPFRFFLHGCDGRGMDHLFLFRGRATHTACKYNDDPLGTILTGYFFLIISLAFGA